MPSALVAFSGGVDSSFLLRVAHDVLGSRCIALTTTSPTMPPDDLDAAKRLVAALGATHVLVDADELAIAGYAENPPNRCYFCKTNLYEVCAAEASRLDIGVVLDGVNVDDLHEHRPGLRAAEEHRVRHLLVEAGFTKAEVRAASRALGLATWDRPASPCLSSRFPYGTRITREGLAQVEAAERLLRAHGFRELRVRHHESIARLEVPAAEMERLVALRDVVVPALRRLGFAYVTLDLQGFRSGSLNETLGPRKHEGPGVSPALRIR